MAGAASPSAVLVSNPSKSMFDAIKLGVSFHSSGLSAPTSESDPSIKCPPLTGVVLDVLLPVHAAMNASVLMNIVKAAPAPTRRRKSRRDHPERNLSKRSDER